MQEGNGGAHAMAMLDLFASVGAKTFDVTWTTCAGAKDGFRRGMSFAELRRKLPVMLETAVASQRNIIVRPHGRGVTFIQLDDLKAEQLPRLARAVFLMLETSLGNFQAWVALAETRDADFARWLRKGTGADATASGATRIAGSRNFKDKYAPDFPRVAIHTAQPGRITSAGELDQLGLVAAPEIVTQPAGRVFSRRSRPGPGRRKWPNYARCIDGAPLNSEESGPDISRADFVFCMTAIDWGFGVEQTAERLMEESVKAQVNGRAYAVLTARNAAAAVERRRQQPSRSPLRDCRR